MNEHPDEHVISLAVDATTDAEVIKTFETLSRVAASLALDGIDVRISHFIYQAEYQSSEDQS